jgi:hypothetical protein
MFPRMRTVKTMNPTKCTWIQFANIVVVVVIVIIIIIIIIIIT